MGNFTKVGKRRNEMRTITLLTVLSSVLLSSAHARDERSVLRAEVDGIPWFYHVKDGGAVLKGVDPCEVNLKKDHRRNVLIPAMVDVFPVRELTEDVFVMSPYWNNETCLTVEVLTLPESLRKIDFRAIKAFRNLARIEVDVRNPVYESEGGGLYIRQDKELFLVPPIPSEVFRIRPGTMCVFPAAFRYADKIESLVIPSSMEGDFPALSHCRALKAITVEIGNKTYYSQNGTVMRRDGVLVACPKAIETYDVDNRIVGIGPCCFSGCTQMKELTIPESVTNISEGAFSGCRRLLSVRLPDGVASIGGFSFRGCLGLRKIALPKNLSMIGTHLFGDCTNLSSISIPREVKVIADNAFWRCSSLSFVEVPQSVTNIGYSAFWGCTSVEEFHISSNECYMDWGVFAGCASLKRIVFEGKVPKRRRRIFEHTPDGLKIVVKKDSREWALFLDQEGFKPRGRFASGQEMTYDRKGW